MNSRRDILTAIAIGIASALALVSCASKTPARPAQPNYDAAIQEGQSAANDVIRAGTTTALGIALTDGNRVIWSQTFGLADRDAGVPPAETTMFGIGSVSKMFATVATMKLVEMGLVALDNPVTDYVPDFQMASADYTKVTVRMLVNHSSGFPGTDYRNADTNSAYPGYAAQVLQTLSESRLKTAPGYMNVYCNDGFTMIELLVKAVTGKTYAQFVKDEILTPLGMAHTTYATAPFADGSYVKGYSNGEVLPQEFLNALASGGVYSTASDMARLAMMFLGDGQAGGTRILSAASIAEMAVDQTAGTFDPVVNNEMIYGLGWDSVAEPGMTAVGFDGWEKGGDCAQYHSALLVSPKAQLGVVVLGAVGFSSTVAAAITERVLLRALSENNLIPEFPSPIPAAVPPVVAVPDGMLATMEGVYANSSSVFQLVAQPDDSVLYMSWTGDNWAPSSQPWKHRGDGWFSSDQKPLSTVKVITANGRQYLVFQSPGGYGHYLDESVYAEKVQGTSDLSAAWTGRVNTLWLAVNAWLNVPLWPVPDPRMRLCTIPELNGIIAVQQDQEMTVVDPSSSDDLATMMLVIPQLMGRDLFDLDILSQNGAELIRRGSYLYEPITAVQAIPPATTQTVVIGPDGYNEWRSVAVDTASVPLNLTTAGGWVVFDSSFNMLYSGNGNAELTLSMGTGLDYIVFVGPPGQTSTVTQPST